MDASHLTQTFVLIAVAIVIGRFFFTTLGRAGDGMAALFVPPDRSLGWPRGVQESDEPWGWRVPASALEEHGGAEEWDQADGPGGTAVGSEPRRGSFVVALTPVAPIRLIVRPH